MFLKNRTDVVFFPSLILILFLFEKEVIFLKSFLLILDTSSGSDLEIAASNIFFRSTSCFFSAKITSGIPRLNFLPTSNLAISSIFFTEYKESSFFALVTEIFPILSYSRISM